MKMTDLMILEENQDKKYLRRKLSRMNAMINAAAETMQGGNMPAKSAVPHAAHLPLTRHPRRVHPLRHHRRLLTAVAPKMRTIGVGENAIVVQVG